MFSDDNLPAYPKLQKTPQYTNPDEYADQDAISEPTVSSQQNRRSRELETLKSDNTGPRTRDAYIDLPPKRQSVNPPEISNASLPKVKKFSSRRDQQQQKYDNLGKESSKTTIDCQDTHQKKTDETEYIKRHTEEERQKQLEALRKLDPMNVMYMNQMAQNSFLYNQL